MIVKNLLFAVGAVAALATTAVNASLDFCFGWNTDCHQVKNPEIQLMKVGPIDVSCDTCYLQTSGSVRLNVEPFTVGVENMVIEFAGEIDSQAVGTWSFDKSEHPTLIRIDLMHGLVPVTLEIPMTVDIQGSVTGNANSRIGISAVGKIGTWESKRVRNHWVHVHPTPVWDIQHKVDGDVNASGDMMITISPVVQLTVGNMFTGKLEINQVAGINIQASLKETLEDSTNDIKCTLCQFVVGQVEQHLAVNSTIEHIASEVTQACNVFPGDMKKGCLSIVNTYLPSIVQYIEARVSPQQICAKIGICPQRLSLGGTECNTCLLLVNVAEQMLASGAVQEKIETVLDNVCTKLGPLTSTCQSVVHTYLPTIVQYLESKLTPQVVCSKLRLCQQLSLESPSTCVTLQEDFSINWSGELKLPIIHVDKTFNEKLMNWQRTIPFGTGCASRLMRQNSWVDANEIIHSVNSINHGWEAGHNKFSHVSFNDLKRMFLDHRKLNMDLITQDLETVSAVDSFDSRTQWPGCVHPVRNQMRCGSCWAFSASEVASDRICISQKTDVVLSPEYILECDHKDMGCNGGMLDTVWGFLTMTGTTTDACRPYTSGSGTVGGKCSNTCADGSQAVIYKARRNSAVMGENQIINEVMKNGPIQVAFSVYQDFMQYKSGVYRHTSGSLLGGHAVELVGWDVVGGVKAWIIKNSWDTTWGEQGYFRIRRGTNECGIESNGYTGYY